MIQGTLEALSNLTFLEWLLLLAILSSIAWITSRFEKPNLPKKKYRRYILIGLVVLNVVFIQLMSSDVLTSVDEVKYGIIDFEMAKTETRADDIRSAWIDEENKVELPVGSGKLVWISDIAEKDIYLDLGFILSYVSLFGFISFWIADVLNQGPLSKAGIMIGWGPLIAGLLDLVENTAMLLMLNHGASGLLAGISFWSALPKFIIILAGFGIYLIVGLITLVVQALRARK